jgi:SAM-dependent methyltransferase
MVDVDAAEDAWRPATRPDIPVVPGRWGAEPYPGLLFTELLDAALGWLGGPARFCDLGAGCGGQILRAQARGCDAWGVEIEPAWAAAARDLGATVICYLAEDADLAGTPVVFLNQLYRNAAGQAALEERIRARMDPGAVLISVNYASVPPGSWTAVFTDPPQRRGVWAKP